MESANLSQISINMKDNIRMTSEEALEILRALGCIGFLISIKHPELQGLIKKVDQSVDILKSKLLV